MDFSKFDSMFDIEGLKDDVKKASENKQEFEDLPLGNYEVRIEKMELVESKKGNPMISIWFKVLSGKYQKHLIFFNQVITKGFQIHIVNELLRSLGTKIDVNFDDFQQYSDLIFDIHEKINRDSLEYELAYGENKGFKTFKICQIFEPEVSDGEIEINL